MIKVNDEYGEFHQIKRKQTKTWVNWGLFYQVWKAVRQSGKWETTDYTVKVDADAVFVPQRLRDYLAKSPGDSPHGLYYENCKNVQYGFFGNPELTCWRRTPPGPGRSLRGSISSRSHRGGSRERRTGTRTSEPPTCAPDQASETSSGRDLELERWGDS